MIKAKSKGTCYVYAYAQNGVFKKIKVVFDRTKSRHEAASAECWMSAQCFALNLPTKTAIQFIYGEKSVGKKKYHRCEVAYSRQAKQVFAWLLDEIELMVQEGVADGLEKWVTILERSRAISWCYDAYNFIKKYSTEFALSFSPALAALCSNEEELFSAIIVNPVEMKSLIENAMREVPNRETSDVNWDKFLEELKGHLSEEEVGEPVPVFASDSDMPF